MTDAAHPEMPQPGQRLPLLPLRDLVVFPHMVVPLFVGRQRSIAALERAMAEDRQLVLCAQKEAAVDEPGPADLYETGALGSIIQLLHMPDGTVKVLIEGQARVSVQRFLSTEPCFEVETQPLEQIEAPSVETEALMRTVRGAFETYVKLNKRLAPELSMSIKTVEEPSVLSDTLASQLHLKLEDKQALLAQGSARLRLEKIVQLLQSEIEISQVERRIRSRVKRQMERSQKERYLSEQMQAIQKELGEPDEFRGELEELSAAIEKKALSKEARDKVTRELRKLKMMAPMSPEAAVIRHYIDWVLALPWEDPAPARIDLDGAEAVLDEEHHGLGKVKERILEHLSVQVLCDGTRGPILCLVGPPGVGKTSLGRSVARAMGRRFVRLSLGGVRDEAEIRGHRRTYIGALPGKIIQHMRKAGTRDPVFLLDEVDKMSTDFRGDPSAALLEVLDPEQNNAFCDHYLELDYDLSRVMFITTANSLQTIPLPLQDRMEVIRLPGYSDEEKLSIARKFLIPKQKVQNGLGGCELAVSDEAVRRIIHEHTHEAGVRELERKLGAICRKIAKELVRQTHAPTFRIGLGSLPRLLGPPSHHRSRPNDSEEPGVATGLAVTQHGGDLLGAEVAVLPGQGKLVHTGKLGEVMQESAQAALTYIRSRAASLGLDPGFYREVDIHVHFPEGAVPKDGPSAGITMATAMASALLRIPVKNDLAMTGEVTLRGRVLPVGGLKDKLLAAQRAGLTTVLFPADNETDLAEVPAGCRRALRLVAVRHMDEVLREALRLPDPSAFLDSHEDALDLRVAQAPPTPSQH